MPTITRRVAVAGAAALVLVGGAVALTPTGAATDATATCAASSYDGATLSIQCTVPQATATVTAPGPTVTVPGPTQTVPGPTVTQTVTVTPNATSSPTAPALPAGWTRVTFFDDFAGNLAKWNVRNNTWASNELSIDTNRPSNVLVSGGSLVERAQRETYTFGSTTRLYTSGYLDTRGRFSQEFGRWEMRAKLPAARGLWPAFWLRTDTGLGELDIMESVVGTGKTVQTVHQSTNGDLAKKGHEDGSVLDLTAWHVYAAEREPGVVRWYIDGRQVFSVTSAQAPWLDDALAGPMNIRLNLQVGGSMPRYYGIPVDDAALPGDFTVDWVRVLAR